MNRLVLNGRETHYKNFVGKTIDKEEDDKSLLSHLMQGYEAAFLKTVYDLYPDQILLYMHDGVVTDGKIDIQIINEYWHFYSLVLMVQKTENLSFGD